MHILTGITGQLEHELKHTLAPLATVTGVGRHDMDHQIVLSG